MPRAGKCLLEWDGGAGGGEPPPVPLLKDMFGSERRKAKVLNFSIAYGKTAHGLARDWGTSLQEAEATVERWYADRPEVRSARSAPISGRCKLQHRGQQRPPSGGLPACMLLASLCQHPLCASDTSQLRPPGTCSHSTPRVRVVDKPG